MPGPVGVFMHVHACSPAYPTCNAYAKYPLFLSDFNETLIFTTDFRQKPELNIKFNQIPSSASRVVSMRTDGHDEANSLFSKFCDRV